MSDGLNGGFWSAILHRDWSAAANNLVALSAAIRPEWITARMTEAVGISLVTSAITIGGGYVVLVSRLDERILAIQRDMDGRTAARKEADAQSNERIKSVEDRLLHNEATIASELAAIREQLGRLDGRTSPRGRP